MDLPYPVRLRPGYVAVRRDDRRLQLGLDTPARAIVPDTAEVRRLLASLEHGLLDAPRDPAMRRALAALHDAGLLVPAHPPAEAADAPVAVDAPDRVRTALTPLLRSAGLRIRPDAPVTLVADEVPVARDRVDPLVRAGRAHLLVSGTPREWTVGPFVLPGATACVRCVDAHLAHRDPRRPIIVDQLARVPRSAQATDPLVRTTALSLAALDLREYAAGRTPATWSATYTVGSGPLVHEEWARHPHCGCAWDLLAAWG